MVNKKKIEVPDFIDTKDAEGNPQRIMCKTGTQDEQDWCRKYVEQQAPASQEVLPTGERWYKRTLYQSKGKEGKEGFKLKVWMILLIVVGGAMVYPILNLLGLAAVFQRPHQGTGWAKCYIMDSASGAEMDGQIALFDFDNQSYIKTINTDELVYLSKDTLACPVISDFSLWSHGWFNQTFALEASSDQTNPRNNTFILHRICPNDYVNATLYKINDTVDSQIAHVTGDKIIQLNVSNTLWSSVGEVEGPYWGLPYLMPNGTYTQYELDNNVDWHGGWIALDVNFTMDNYIVDLGSIPAPVYNVTTGLWVSPLLGTPVAAPWEIITVTLHIPTGTPTFIHLYQNAVGDYASFANVTVT